MSILDHITLVVSDYARSVAFYKTALAPLGIEAVMEFGQACGFGRNKKPEFWVGGGPTEFQKPEHLRLITPTHVAFVAKNRAEVAAFHEAALAAGGRDFGAPGVRAHYHPNYYAAFVLDPDGNDIEAVTHGDAGAVAERGESGESGGAGGGAGGAQVAPASRDPVDEGRGMR